VQVVQELQQIVMGIWISVQRKKKKKMFSIWMFGAQYLDPNSGNLGS